MKALVAATLVLVIAVADFVVRGRGFLAQEQAALAALDERIERVTTMQREMPVVSRAEHDDGVDLIAIVGPRRDKHAQEVEPDVGDAKRRDDQERPR